MNRLLLANTALIILLFLAPGEVRAVGGDDCATATVIGALPYTDTGNTCSFNNWYDEHCPNHSVSAEVVYAYTPTTNQCVDVSLCGATSFDSKLYVYASDAGGCPLPPVDNSGLQIACNDDACPVPGNLASEITGLALTAGVTYAFVVDGSSDQCGGYQITISACTGTSCTTDADCDDAVFCNGAEFCDTAQTCQPGTPPDCDDSNPCTDDVCDVEMDACINTPIPGCCTSDPECDDGVFCNGPESCAPTLVCQPGTPPDCDDGNPCTDDSCDQVVDACANTPIPGCCTIDADCDDGVFCNGPESCNATSLSCEPGTPPDCDDSDPCTADACDPEVDACVNAIIADCCTTDAECDDGNPCTDNVCNTNVCEHPPLSGTLCGNPGDTVCTDPDTCDAAGACQPNHASDGTPCDDGDACTDNDACSSGSCTGSPNLVCETCAQSGPPEDPVNQLSFQARLNDATGNPVQGLVGLEFQFYDLVGGYIGPPAIMTGVPVTDGIVTTPIPVPDGVFDGTGRMLGVRVNGGAELSPRIPLTSAPQSFRVGCVESQEVVSHVALGGPTESGSLDLYNASGELVFTLDIDPATGAPVWTMYAVSQGQRAPRPAIVSVANMGYIADVCDGGAEQSYLNSDGAKTIVLRAEQCPDMGDVGAYVTMSDGTSRTIALDADDGVSGGAAMHLSNSLGRETVTVDADDSDSAKLTLWRNIIGGVTKGIVLDAKSGSGAHVGIYNEDGRKTVSINGSSGALPRGDGGIEIRNRDNDTTIALYGGSIWGGRSGEIRLYDSDSPLIPTITLNAAAGGVGKVTTQVLAVTGGSDLSEQFDIAGPTGDVKPGMVVSIDPTRPGKLVISSMAYDRRVAGVISGAGGVAPGMLMGQSGSVADGEHPVALTGRVYCRADASTEPIQAGDLLTTSDTAGHVMKVKVKDYDRAQGAIVGKAMTSLEQGQGLILVLVTLQ